MYTDLSLKILDHLPYSLLVIDQKFTPLYCNLAFLDLIEQSEQANAFKLTSIFNDLNSLIADQGPRFSRINTVNNKSINVYISISLLDENVYLVELSRLSSSAHDYQGKRLETLGLLASSIVHDFNNFLAGIIGHVAFLKSILPKEGRHLASIESIEQGSMNASEITKEILRFSKQRDSAESQNIELNNLIQRTIKILLASINPKIKVEFVSSVQDVRVKCVDVRITQILVNLIVNAQDAILESNCTVQKILVTLDVVEDPVVKLKLSNNTLHQGRYACLTVKDYGSGIPNELQEKIFQPYFSTKGEKGTGLGLTTVASIVYELKGLIDISSETGKGTEIRILLPISDSNVEITKESLQQESAGQIIQKNERILVVDDEDVVRNVLGLNLEQLGYNVQLEGSALKAIDYYKNQRNDISLVILDMLMPELSGEEVFEIIREINPKQKILIVSGFCSDDLIEMMLESKNCDFLAKPFMIEELSLKINSLMLS